MKNYGSALKGTYVQCYPRELCAMMEMSYIELSNTEATTHMQFLSA